MNALERYLCKRKAKQMDGQLALFVLSLRTKLLAGLTLERSLEKLTNELAEPIKGELSKILKETEKGKDISDAFAHAASLTCSLEFKKVLSHLNEIAKSGYSRKNDTLKLLGKELASVQTTKIREYSSKLAVLSLLFIACAVLMPALWLAFVVMGSAFFALEITSLQIFFVVCVVFP
ncbi:MAG: type II secretion system F family protein, partial [Candidatus Diapherotrites archaeon]